MAIGMRRTNYFNILPENYFSPPETSDILVCLILCSFVGVTRSIFSLAKQLQNHHLTISAFQAVSSLCGGDLFWCSCCLL